jgi:hypothetical protein
VPHNPITCHARTFQSGIQKPLYRHRARARLAQFKRKPWTAEAMLQPHATQPNYLSCPNVSIGHPKAPQSIPLPTGREHRSRNPKGNLGLLKPRFSPVPHNPVTCHARTFQSGIQKPLYRHRARARLAQFKRKPWTAEAALQPRIL